MKAQGLEDLESGAERSIQGRKAQAQEFATRNGQHFDCQDHLEIERFFKQHLSIW